MDGIAREGEKEAAQPSPAAPHQPTSSRAAAAADAASDAGIQVDSEKLAELIQMGMDPEKAALALRQHSNDLQRAMDALLDDSEPMQH